MKFDINARELSNCLSLLYKAIPNKTSLPLFECFLFNVKCNVMKVTASDTETRLNARVDVFNTLGEGLFAVGAKLLIKPLSELKGQLLTFNVNDVTKEVTVHYSNGEFSVVGMDATTYPEMNGGNDGEEYAMAINALVLKHTIERTINQVSDDTLRPVMCGILFDVKESAVSFCATNGNKLVAIHEQMNTEKFTPFSFILSKRSAMLLNGFLGNENEIKISVKGNKSSFVGDNFTMECRLIEGRYPNYESVIPKSYANKATFNKAELVNAIRRVSAFANPETALIAIDFADEKSTVKAKDVDFATSANEKIDCMYLGADLSIGLKSTYLMDLLSVVETEDVIIESNNDKQAIMIRPDDSEIKGRVRMILMPMMLD